MSDSTSRLYALVLKVSPGKPRCGLSYECETLCGWVAAVHAKRIRVYVGNGDKV